MARDSMGKGYDDSGVSEQYEERDNETTGRIIYGAVLGSLGRVGRVGRVGKALSDSYLCSLYSLYSLYSL